MLRFKPADSVFYPRVDAPGMTSEPQDMFLWPNIQVCACTRSLTNSLRYITIYSIVSVGEDTVLDGDFLTKEEV